MNMFWHGDIDKAEMGDRVARAFLSENRGSKLGRRICILVAGIDAQLGGVGW